MSIYVSPSKNTRLRDAASNTVLAPPGAHFKHVPLYCVIDTATGEVTATIWQRGQTYVVTDTTAKPKGERGTLLGRVGPDHPERTSILMATGPVVAGSRIEAMALAYGRLRPAASPSQLVDAARCFKKVPSFCVVDPQSREVKETLWQMGPNQYFLGRGTTKPSRKGGEFLGRMLRRDAGGCVFNVSLVSDEPCHTVPSVDVAAPTYAEALARAYATRRTLRVVSVPEPTESVTVRVKA